jgi:hypothetical protein
MDDQEKLHAKSKKKGPILKIGPFEKVQKKGPFFKKVAEKGPIFKTTRCLSE